MFSLVFPTIDATLTFSLMCPFLILLSLNNNHSTRDTSILVISFPVQTSSIEFFYLPPTHWSIYLYNIITGDFTECFVIPTFQSYRHPPLLNVFQFHIGNHNIIIVIYFCYKIILTIYYHGFTVLGKCSQRTRINRIWNMYTGRSR